MNEFIILRKRVKNSLRRIVGLVNYPETSIRWKGTQVDLMEFAYGLYLTGMLVDQSGRKATLVETTEFVFKMFGCTPPQNPSRVITTLRQRAQPRELSVMYKNLCDLYPGCFSVKK